ncbi:MAG TPA: radical SAM protein [Verrucomicrobiales bacterium]|nr:radical SAM protein [Verrucomicrobiales bacterium]
MNETVYHITVLSNFARGYDKYRRVYTKTGIPESAYPDRFYVLREDELAIGVRKAGALLTKLNLPGNRLIALRTSLPPAGLQPNERNGLGRVWPHRDLPLEAVCDVQECAEEFCAVPIPLEDAAADSLRLLRGDLMTYESLQPRTVSVLPIARGCQAACPFCFSDASVSAAQEQGKVDFERVEKILHAGKLQGASRAVITGGGEPTLLREEPMRELIGSCAREFKKVVLITNGYRHAHMEEARCIEALAGLARAGLSVLNVSRHHHDETRNTAVMKLATASGRLASVWQRHREQFPALGFRLTCVLQRGGIEDAQRVRDYVAWAASLGVPEICFKELYVSTSRESVYHSASANEWAAQHQVPLALVTDFAAEHGFREVTRLPWGAPVFRGECNGREIAIAAYTEPSLFWERTHGIARSWNLMADGRCLVSLEDRASEIQVPLAA